MSRCERRSFWAGGVKIFSGEATAWTPDGPLKVVCGRAKAGEINVQELADGVPLDVPTIGFLTFDAARWRGRKGRSVSALETMETMGLQTSMALKDRAIQCRDDQELVAMVFTRSIGWVPKRGFRTAVRRNRHLWPEMIDAILEDGKFAPHVDGYAAHLALEVIDDPVLLSHVMHHKPIDARSGGLQSAAAVRLAASGFHRDAGAFLRSIKDTGERSSRVFDLFEVMSAFPVPYLEEFSRELLHDPLWSSAVPSLMLRIARTESYSRQERNERVTLFLSLLDEITPNTENRHPMDTPVDEAVEYLRKLARSTPPHHGVEAAEYASMDDEALLADLIGDFSSREYVPRLIEAARRDLPNAPYQAHPDFRWMKMMLRTGVSETALRNSFHHPSARADAVEKLSERDLRWVVSSGNTPLATVRALVRLNDPAAWQEFIDAIPQEEYFRWVVEHIPASSIPDLLRHLTLSPARTTIALEVATYRGSIRPEVALGSASIAVRTAAVKKLKDDDLIASALQDDAPGVARAAIRRCRSITALDELTATLTGHTENEEQLRSATKQRRDQLVAFELVQKSLERDEVVVARAALELIHDRALLLELTRHAELSSFIAHRLQRITVRPRRYK